MCAAFNADFDGDQMAVHVPLSTEAQAEARILMLSSNNILSPANGRPITTPTQDMVLGIYTLTTMTSASKDVLDNELPAYSSIAEAVMALDRGSLLLGQKARFRLADSTPPALGHEVPLKVGLSAIHSRSYPPLAASCSMKRCHLTTHLSTRRLIRRSSAATVNRLSEMYPKIEVAETLDQLKSLGFHWASRSGVTISISDVVAPSAKAGLIANAEEKDAKVQQQYEKGLITDSERRQELIEIWTRATDEVAKAMQDNFPESNPVHIMVDSGARGNYMQVRQIAGMRGLVANPKGEIIPRPIKANFREGLTVLEYFISTHGARKGLADTALRTADSGYLTRRLVDVSQDVIVREVDCETERGAEIEIAEMVDGNSAPS